MLLKKMNGSNFLIIFTLVFSTGCLEKNDEKSGLLFNKVTNSRTVASEKNLEQSGLNIRMSDRFYVSSLLQDVFGEAANNPINNLVNAKMDSFGGGCDQYDRNTNISNTCLNDNCTQVTCNGAEIIHNQLGVSSVIRVGWLTKTCEEITNNDSATLYAVRNILVQPTVPQSGVPIPNNNTLKKSYELFYRSGVSPNNNILSALSTIAATETTNNFEKWRYVFLALCVTPEWQIP